MSATSSKDVPTKTISNEEQLDGALLFLNSKVLGLVLGLIAGSVVFAMTNWLVLRGGHISEAGEYVVGPHLRLLGQFFLGYRVTFVGSLVGFAYGFAFGTLTGSVVGWVYNKLAGLRQ